MTAHNKLLFVINTFSARPGALLGLREGAGAAHTHLLGILNVGMTELDWKF